MKEDFTVSRLPKSLLEYVPLHKTIAFFNAGSITLKSVSENESMRHAKKPEKVLLFAQVLTCVSLRVGRVIVLEHDRHFKVNICGMMKTFILNRVVLD